MNEDIIRLLLDRLNAVADPVFSPAELPGVPRSAWDDLERARIFRRVGEPEWIDRDGKLLAIRRAGGLIFGFDEDEEFPRPMPLTEKDLVTYRLNLSGFLDAIREQNAIDGRDASPWHGFYHVGRRRLPHAGMTSIYLSLQNADLEETERRLNLLADQSEATVAIFPVRPALDVSKYSHQDIYVVDLSHDLFINWPNNIHSASDPDPEYAFLATHRKWMIHFLGESVEVDHLVGMNYIAKALERPDEKIPLRELEEEIFLTADDKEKSGDLSARLEADNNLEAITPETLENYKAAARLLERKIRDAKKAGNADAVKEFTLQHSEITRQIRRNTTPAGKIREINKAHESRRKRISKNLNRAFDAIAMEHQAIGRHLRNRVVLRRGKLTHTPDTGEEWVVRFPEKKVLRPRK